MLSAFRDHPAGTVRINSSEYAASADLPEAARMAAALPPHQNRGAHQQSLGGYCRPTFRYGCALRFGCGQRHERCAHLARHADVRGRHTYLSGGQNSTGHIAGIGRERLFGAENQPFRRPVHEMGICRIRQNYRGCHPRAAYLQQQSAAAHCRPRRHGAGMAAAPDGGRPDIQSGTLVTVLDEFATGHYLYYTGRHDNSSVFKLLVNALRYRGGDGA